MNPVVASLKGYLELRLVGDAAARQIRRAPSFSVTTAHRLLATPLLRLRHHGRRRHSCMTVGHLANCDGGGSDNGYPE